MGINLKRPIFINILIHKTLAKKSQIQSYRICIFYIKYKTTIKLEKVIQL